MIKTIPVLRGVAKAATPEAPKEDLSNVLVISAQGVKLPKSAALALAAEKGDKISFGPVYDKDDQPTGDFAIYKDNVNGKIELNDKLITTNSVLSGSLLKHANQEFVKGTDFLFEVSPLKYDEDSNTPYVSVTWKGTKKGRAERRPSTQPVKAAFTSPSSAPTGVTEEAYVDRADMEQPVVQPATAPVDTTFNFD